MAKAHKGVDWVGHIHPCFPKAVFIHKQSVKMAGYLFQDLILKSTALFHSRDVPVSQRFHLTKVTINNG